MQGRLHCTVHPSRYPRASTRSENTREARDQGSLPSRACDCVAKDTQVSVCSTSMHASTQHDTRPHERSELGGHWTAIARESGHWHCVVCAKVYQSAWHDSDQGAVSLR